MNMLFHPALSASHFMRTQPHLGTWFLTAPAGGANGEDDGGDLLVWNWELSLFRMVVVGALFN